MNKKVILPTRSQLRVTRTNIIDQLYDKRMGYNLTFFTALFGCTKKTTVSMFQDVKKIREARNANHN